MRTVCSHDVVNQQEAHLARCLAGVLLECVDRACCQVCFGGLLLGHKRARRPACTGGGMVHAPLSGEAQCDESMRLCCCACTSGLQSRRCFRRSQLIALLFSSSEGSRGSGSRWDARSQGIVIRSIAAIRAGLAGLQLPIVYLAKPVAGRVFSWRGRLICEGSKHNYSCEQRLLACDNGHAALVSARPNPYGAQLTSPRLQDLGGFSHSGMTVPAPGMGICSCRASRGICQVQQCGSERTQWLAINSSRRTAVAAPAWLLGKRTA